MDENARALIEQVAREIEIKTEVNTLEQFRIQLVNAIEMLLQKDFPRLIQILYRLDVDEEKLKTQLKNNSGSDTAEVISDMIMTRQLQKLEMRDRKSVV